MDMKSIRWTLIFLKNILDTSLFDSVVTPGPKQETQRLITFCSYIIKLMDGCDQNIFATIDQKIFGTQTNETCTNILSFMVISLEYKESITETLRKCLVH